MKLINGIKKGLDILLGRLREQGLRTTILWFYAQGISLTTGIPIMKFCQITPQIFVGPQYRRMGRRKLARLGVNSDVNMRVEFDDAKHGLAMERYCHLPTFDGEVPTLTQLNQGVAFIRQALEDGGKVYIHCAQGVGRAPTLAAAYFICQGFTPDEAVNLLKRSRPFIRISSAQMNQLKRLSAVHGKNSG
ncbi:MAG: dual specificity protein phosphatase family protein [Anaerolineales bacterium]|nr:dual specificity protein phosphatase family protein [Anaerolineales bacterium]